MSYDVALGTLELMVLPGSYRADVTGRSSASASAKRALLADDDLARGCYAPDSVLHSSENARRAPWPAGIGGAIAPATVARQVSGSLNTSTKVPLPSADYLFVGAGSTLYRWARAIGTAATNYKTTLATIQALCLHEDDLYIGEGAGADVQKVDLGTGSTTNSALGAGVKASRLWSYAHGIARVDPSFPGTLHYIYGSALGYTLSWKMPGTIINAVPWNDSLLIAHDGGLSRLTGTWEQHVDPPAPEHNLACTSWGSQPNYQSAADDYDWMQVYRGLVYTWLAGRVVRYDPRTERWEPVGLRGSATTGAAVVDDTLYVGVLTTGGTYQLWGYDGDGWLCYDDVGGTNTLAALSADGGGRIAAFNHSATSWRVYEPSDTTGTTTQASPLTIATRALDGGRPDTSKSWTTIGVELGRDDGQTVGAWTLACDYSTDGGASWISAGAAASITSERQSASWPVNVSANELRVRLTLTQASGLPPAILAIWAEHTESTAASSGRRRWQFRTRATDNLITRTGAYDGRSGETIRDAIWALWEGGSSFAFTDPAGDAFAGCRLVAVDEAWPRAADAGTGHHTELTLTIEEG